MAATSVTPQGKSPTHIGRLEVVRALGRGLMGEVFEARDPASGHRFVVKRLRPQTRELVDLLRFKREAELMRRLEHPNIMPILHVETNAEPPFYVMPLREGRPVSQRLVESGCLPEVLVTRIGRDVCAALSEAHRRGIVHRDVKPANLLLEASGSTVLLDFGLAKTLEGTEALTAVGAILGTPAYMAPEQVRGDVSDARCDVYSLGVTLFELLIGQNPFWTPDVIETLRRQLQETPRRANALLPHKVSSELGELIHRMIAKETRHRPNAETCLETFAGLARRHERELSTPTRATIRPSLAG